MEKKLESWIKNNLEYEDRKDAKDAWQECLNFIHSPHIAAQVALIRDQARVKISNEIIGDTHDWKKKVSFALKGVVYTRVLHKIKDLEAAQ